MNRHEVAWLKSSIKSHLELFFENQAIFEYDNFKVNWGNYRDFHDPPAGELVIPIDLEEGIVPRSPWVVSFGDTELNFWNPVLPLNSRWTFLPEENPLWLVHENGAVMPAWNLATTLFDLLNFREERELLARDRHDRFIGSMSPRDQRHLLRAPIFNDSVAALIAGIHGMSNDGKPHAKIDSSLLRAPRIVLSHDLDQLRGNDFWTQSVRVYRALVPKRNYFKGLATAVVNIRENFKNPEKYYLDDLYKMLELESAFGFTSTCYFLSGHGGRFGARSGDGKLGEVAHETRQFGSIGVHYNYDTYLNRSALLNQVRGLESKVGAKITNGRAHYLRIDTANSWRMLKDVGISLDESLGFPDRIGYRAGIAGPYIPFEAVKDSSTVGPIVMPLVFMESTLRSEAVGDPLRRFSEMSKHIKHVGGAISFLIHPGYYENPEFPEYFGLYREILAIAQEHQYLSWLPENIVSEYLRGLG